MSLSIENQIDGLVAASNAAHDSVTMAVHASPGSMQHAAHQRNTLGYTYNTGTDKLEITSGEQPPDLPEAGAVRIPDYGQDIGAEIQSLQSMVDGLIGKLAEHTFDPKTGAKVYTLPEQSTERYKAIRALEQADKSAMYELQRLSLLQGQREADAIADAAAKSEHAAKVAFANGDPKRMQMLEEALSRKEAEEVAASIWNARVAGKAAGLR